MVEITIKINGDTITTTKAKEVIKLAQELCLLEADEIKDKVSSVKVEEVETTENKDRQETEEVKEAETTENEDTAEIQDAAKDEFKKCIRSSKGAKAKAKELLNSLGVEKFTELDSVLKTKKEWSDFIEELQKLS